MELFRGLIGPLGYILVLRLFLVMASLFLAFCLDNGWAQEDPSIGQMNIVESSVEQASSSDETLQTRTVTLAFADAAKLAALLQPMTSPHGHITFDEKLKTLTMTDTQAGIERMTAFIKEADVERFTMVFELGLAKASELAPKIEEMLTGNVGRIKVDEKTNKLIVSDTSAKIEEVRKFVEQIDRRNRQVVLEAKIVQILLNDEHRMGVDWEAIVSDYRSLALTDGSSELPNGQTHGKMSVGTIANEDFSILIEALDTVGTVHILSSPGITAIHNKEARILAGVSPPHTAFKEPSLSGGSSAAAESVHFVDIGVRLFVTPDIGSDGSITMKIRPEVSSVTGSVAEGKQRTTPVVETYGAATSVIVKQGITIVIGGLIKEEKSKITKKVPILGDVPFLGVAFRSYSHSVKKTEIVIFLEPVIPAGDDKDKQDAL